MRIRKEKPQVGQMWVTVRLGLVTIVAERVAQKRLRKYIVYDVLDADGKKHTLASSHSLRARVL